MIRNVIAYSGIHAKIKAMESRLLDYDDFYSLANQEDVLHFAQKLSEKIAYTDIINELIASEMSKRMPIERSLVKSMYKDFSGIFSFITDKSERNYLDSIFLKYEIGIIKALLRRMFDERSIRNVIPSYDKFITNHLKINVEKLVSSQNFKEFLNNLKDTKFYKVLSKVDMENPTLFELETQLDFFCYSETWRYQYKYLTKANRKILERINGADIDLHNIKHIYRFKKFYDLDKSLIYSYLFPINFRISREVIDNLINSKSDPEFFEVLKRTHYKDVFKSYELGGMERDYYIYMYKLHDSEEIRNPFSLATVTSYFYKKGQEIRNLTTLLECVRYNLKPEESMKMLNIEQKRAAV